MKRKNLTVLTAVGVFMLIFLTGPGSQLILASPAADEVHSIRPLVSREKPRIDGILDDAVWQTSPLEKDFISYQPIYGETLPYKTLVRAAYDSKNLYFAFLCLDPDPQQIKTSISERDNIFTDDWVGLSLDALGNKQTSYHFFVNPNGIQLDKLNSAVSGEDAAPDFVWKSAGKITENGYQVEIGIPLNSIGFKSGKEVEMGVLFWRRISRLGISGSWPETKPGRGIFNTHTPIIYKSLKKNLKIEVLPSITYGSNRERMNPQEWQKTDTVSNFGIGLKYGITSSTTLELTLNPDFSQVESDAFQVEVNQRYPLFYSEKRPFFMEGMDIFRFFTMHDGYFSSAVHTRRIVDPFWGAKLTGTTGKIAFGILAAGDEWPGQSWGSTVNPNEGQQAFYGIARGKYSLGKDNYIGVLYSGREFDDRFNRVIGTDVGFRFLKFHRFNASFLYSTSAPESNDSANTGNNTSINYNFRYIYDTKPLVIISAFEHIGTDFRMDSAYLKRTGISEGYVLVGYNFFPKKLPWFKQINPRIAFQYLHDLETQKDDPLLQASLIFNFIKQGYLRFDHYTWKENWNDQAFNLNETSLRGQVQLTKWLFLNGRASRGEGIYYAAEPSYKGKSRSESLSLVFQPNKNLNQQFNFSHSDLSRDNNKIYDVNIFYSRTTYQFNKYFFLRAVLQYDSYQKRMLTDFLASFTLIPGTVLHVGYGGLYENRQWQDDRWEYRQGDMLGIKRSFFLKASYLWRF